MDAARSDAMSATRSSRAGVAAYRAAQPAANAAPKFLARNTTIRRIRLVEEQIFDTLFLARLAIREAPLEQHALAFRSARIAKADSVAGRCCA
jgi:hypothetical protein